MSSSTCIPIFRLVKDSFLLPCPQMQFGIFLFVLKSDFQKIEKTAKNEENPRQSRVFCLASFLSRYIVGGFRNFALCANIRTLYAWQASLPISEWRMRTGFRYASLAERGPTKRVARPKRAGHAIACLFFLRRVDKKDASSKWRKFLYIKGFQQFLKYFQRFFRVWRDAFKNQRVDKKNASVFPDKL